MQQTSVPVDPPNTSADNSKQRSQAALGRIDTQLRQIFPSANNEPFGGLSVMIVEDFGQLPLGGERSMFRTEAEQAASRRNNMHTTGLAAYLAISGSITLDVVMRQDGHDSETKAFKSHLGRLRSGMPTLADFALPQDSVLHRARAGRAANNRQCVLPFEIKGERSYGQQTGLLNPTKSVLLIPARNTGVSFVSANDDQAEGFANHVYMMGGMITATSGQFRA